MTISDVRRLTEDDAQKQLNELIGLDDFLDKCKTCGLPSLLLKGSIRTPRNRLEVEEEY